MATLVGCSGRDEASSTPVEQAVAAASQSEPAAQASNSQPVVGRKLMIIGGQTDVMAGTVTEDAVFVDRLLADVGGSKKLRVLVVPGASGVPNWFPTYLRQVLITRGVPESNLDLAHIAAVDDDSTPGVNESKWQDGAYQPSEVAKVANANVVWYAGGDQSRLVKLLLDAAGKDSPFQAAVKAKLGANNLIVAGYSAGAAVMSDPMIGGGSSWGALTLPPDPDPACNTDALCVTRGLGYIPAQYSALTDQHFLQRGRFPRLVRALSLTNQRVGWGVGAYTAFYVDLASQTRK
jgi:cyanophycinase